MRADCFNPMFLPDTSEERGGGFASRQRDDPIRRYATKHVLGDVMTRMRVVSFFMAIALVGAMAGTVSAASPAKDPARLVDAIMRASDPNTAFAALSPSQQRAVVDYTTLAYVTASESVIVPIAGATSGLVASPPVGAGPGRGAGLGTIRSAFSCGSSSSESTGAAMARRSRRSTLAVPGAPSTIRGGHTTAWLGTSRVEGLVSSGITRSDKACSPTALRGRFQTKTSTRGLI